jgi:U3 small nucleolar RNA-associated protein 25
VRFSCFCCHASNLLSSDASSAADGFPTEDLSENEMDHEEAGDDASDSEEEDQNAGQSYNELLQLLQATDSKGPARKKRKVEHKEEKVKKLKTDAVVEGAEEEEKEEEEEAVANDLEQQEPSDEEDANLDEANADEQDSDTEDGMLWPSACRLISSDCTGTDPFESHFANPKEADLTKKIQAVEAKKWTTAKKETESLRLVRSVPEGAEASFLPAMKSLANIKVRHVEGQIEHAD